MNVSDPLWNNPAGNSTSSSTATTSSLAATGTAQIEGPKLLLRQALETTSSLSASFTTTSLGTVTPTPGGNNFSQSQTDQIVAAITHSGGSGHLWNFKSFWYIAVIVTALTIMLPLVAGGILRATYRFSYNHKNYWHIAVFLFVLGVLIVLDYFMHLCRSSSGLLVLHRLSLLCGNCTKLRNRARTSDAGLGIPPYLQSALA
jgi:hypothetical protein